MRNDEVWDLPVGWNAAPLDRLVDIQSGFAYSKKNLVPASIGVAHLRPFNVRTDGRVDLSEVYYIPPDFKDNVEDYALEPGNVLFNNTNSVELVGKTALVTEPMPCAFSNHIYRLAVKEKARGQLEPAWLVLALRQLWATGYFAEQCNRWIGQAGFNATKLKEVAIPIPPLDEQRRIVARIEELSERMEEARCLRTSAEEDAERLMPAALAELFGQTEPEGDWKVEDLCEIRGGLQKSPKRQPKDNPRPYLRVANVQRGHLVLDDIAYFEVSDSELERYRLLSGDVLIIEGNGSPSLVGRTAIFRGEIKDCVHQNHVIRLRPDTSRILPEALSAYLSSPLGRSIIENLSHTSSGLLNLSIGKIRNIPVPSFPLSKQRHIVDYLDGVQAQVVELTRLQAASAAELARLRGAVLAQAFRGEL